MYIENKPLTKQEVKELVAELAQQPKLIEQEVLRISSDLTKKLDRTEALLVKLERWTIS